jgi:hypothetical protein
MRDYKFRGKRIDNGEWVYGNLVKTAYGLYIIPQNIIADQIPKYSVDPKSVGQYAELLDINRKEIYEGDITENEAGKRFQVRWGINSNGFIAQTRDVHSNVYSSYHLVPKTKWIGTMHENPELLIV